MVLSHKLLSGLFSLKPLVKCTYAHQLKNIWSVLHPEKSDLTMQCFNPCSFIFFYSVVIRWHHMNWTCSSRAECLIFLLDNILGRNLRHSISLVFFLSTPSSFGLHSAWLYFLMPCTLPLQPFHIAVSFHPTQPRPSSREHVISASEIHHRHFLSSH